MPTNSTACATTPRRSPRCPSRRCRGRACWRAMRGTRALVRGVLAWCKQKKLSSWHLLFGDDEDIAACATRPHAAPHGAVPLENSGPRRRRLRRLPRHASRRKAQEDPPGAAQGGRGRRQLPPCAGSGDRAPDWDFFYRCYERTYLEHGNPPYLTRDFFRRMASAMPENWLLFVAERRGRPIAAA